MLMVDNAHSGAPWTCSACKYTGDSKDLHWACGESSRAQGWPSALGKSSKTSNGNCAETYCFACRPARPTTATQLEPTARIEQRNVKHGTVREVQWQPVVEGCRLNGSFYFDDCSNRGVVDKAPAWKEITDSTARARLLELGTLGAGGEFVPTIGPRTVKYQVGEQHYTASVTADSTTSCSDREKVQLTQHLFNKTAVIDLPAQEVDDLLGLCLSGDDCVVKGHKGIAALAQLFSSFGSGFTYTQGKSNLWLKPACLNEWLRVARERKYTHVRLLMHGSGAYVTIK